MRSLEWYHSFPELGIKGFLLYDYEKFVQQLIPQDLTGKTVLDLGAFDGYYSYLAYKRGAKIVVAIDNGIHEEFGYETADTYSKPPTYFHSIPEERELAIQRLYEKYSILKNKFGIDIHFIPMNVNNIDTIEMKFDYIFCFGLYYHLKNPYDLFEKCYNKCNEKLLIEGAIMDGTEPVMYINNRFELNEDPTNFWTPTPHLIVKLLKRIGFRKVKIIAENRGRAIFSCSK